MSIYDEVAKQSTATADTIEAYTEIIRGAGAGWSFAQKVALATLFANNHIDKTDVEGFAGAYGRLSYNHIIEKEQQPGQGVSEVNREILDLVIEKYEELEALLSKCEALEANNT